MNGKAFIDSNIFIYSYDPRDATKQSIALELIRELTISGAAVISYQVVHEFFNFALRKAAITIRQDDAQILLQDVFRPLRTVPSSLALISDAIHIQHRHRLSWYDSLIVSAAQHAGCGILYSEDLQHGQQFGFVTVRDPFR
jgi:predicted nucleic acid-binding protein